MDFLRLTVDDHGQRLRTGHAQVFERLRALAPGNEVGGRDDVAIAAAIRLPYGNNPIRVGVRQRLQHDRADDAEDGGCRADAQGKCQQGCCRQAWRPPEQADALSQIAARVLQQRRTELVARALLHAVHAAELEHRVSAGLVRTHARAPVLLGLLIEVKPDLLVETVLQGIAPGDRTKASPRFAYKTHGAHFAVVASSTRLTARDIRRHLASSSLNCRRPGRVRE